MFYNSKPGYLERADYTWSSDSIRFINTPSLSARQTFFYVQEAGYFKTEPPYFTERAGLKSFLVFYTISGEGLLKYRDGSYPLMPKSAVMINCAEHHYYECAKNNSWEFLWLHFNGPSALGYYEEYAKRDPGVISGEVCSPIEQTIRSILSLLQSQSPNAEILVSNLIANILTTLLIAEEKASSSNSYMPDYLKDAIKLIENRFTESLSLDLLSKTVGISKYHLARVFKEYMGITIKEYIILRRINYAKELLRYTDRTIEEIAYQCGFNQCSHFINMFKSYEDITPKRFRLEWT